MHGSFCWHCLNPASPERSSSVQHLKAANLVTPLILANTVEFEKIYNLLNKYCCVHLNPDSLSEPSGETQNCKPECKYNVFQAVNLGSFLPGVCQCLLDSKM